MDDFSSLCDSVLQPIPGWSRTNSTEVSRYLRDYINPPVPGSSKRTSQNVHRSLSDELRDAQNRAKELQTRLERLREAQSTTTGLGAQASAAGDDVKDVLEKLQGVQEDVADHIAAVIDGISTPELWAIFKMVVSLEDRLQPCRGVSEAQVTTNASNSRQGDGRDPGEGNSRAVVSETPPAAHLLPQSVPSSTNVGVVYSNPRNTEARITMGRFPVHQNCLHEPWHDLDELHNPDQQPRGSQRAQLVVSAYIRDKINILYELPKLGYMEICELRHLKRWLIYRSLLKQTGDISRTEKLLQLILLLQEGLCFERLAALFSRMPREVKRSCDEAFHGLLEMHGETTFPQARLVLDQFWKITEAYVNMAARGTNPESYYGFRSEDVLKVLSTLNLYMGRFRRQNRVALCGDYVEWWKGLQPGGESTVG